MSDFAYSDSNPRRPNQVAPSWLSSFTSTLAAVLVGGLILGIAARSYLRWSVAEGMRDIGDRMNQVGKH